MYLCIVYFSALQIRSQVRKSQGSAPIYKPMVYLIEECNAFYEVDENISDFNRLTNSCSMLSTTEMTAASAIGLSQNRQLQSFPNEKICIFHNGSITEIILPILFEVGSMSP